MNFKAKLKYGDRVVGTRRPELSIKTIFLRNYLLREKNVYSHMVTEYCNKNPVRSWAVGYEKLSYLEKRPIYRYILSNL